jgi:HSP20 family protein
MEIDRLARMFEDVYKGVRAWIPAVDVYETAAHEYVIKVELPELTREAIAVTFEQNVLTISGERKVSTDDDAGTYHRSERPHGTFSRSFTLPATADGGRISASYKDGVLTVRVPQREDAKPKQINVAVE